MMQRKQAPKGGITIAGVFYKGGQFLPADAQPKRGKYNGSKSKIKTPRKVEIAPYEWVEDRENWTSLYRQIAGSVATRDWDNDSKQLVYVGNPQILKYRGMTEDQAKALIKAYNDGARWYDPKTSETS